jgi:DNA-binding SARP family transcriptional activator
VASLTARLFGRFEADLGARDRERIGSRAQELLSFLLLRRDRAFKREALAGMLWGDCPAETSRKHLRQALWQVQVALGTACDQRITTVDEDWVGLNPGLEIWSDVDEFQRVAKLVGGLRGSAMSARLTEQVRHAVELYRGDLLEGWYQEWCLADRERLQSLLLQLMDKLMGYAEAHREIELGLYYGERILAYDRAREQTHRQMMTLHHLSGNRTDAIRQYRRCVSILAEELGVRPSKTTVDLHDRIRADAATAQANGVPTPPLAQMQPELLVQLKQLSQTLANLQQIVREQIDMIGSDGCSADSTT